ncbi:zinc ribbon domain-containing protein [Nocardia brasiliensis]|uniref:Zinc ribbon domain-containing protein n=2 Tax=Nocardia brasiliensis TaxID=37326 RepID=A0A6G9Y3T8_NOCBR|nr:zinc ribbon domain-containing protein [Nocardia brasiliensis]
MACGGFDLAFPMAEVPGAAPCPDCAADSRRQFGGGALIRPGAAATRLLDATGRTATEPAVVSAPPRRSAPVTRNPLHRKLPRP